MYDEKDVSSIKLGISERTVYQTCKHNTALIEHHVTPGAHHYVLGLYVAVDHAVLGAMVDGAQQLVGDPTGIFGPYTVRICVGDVFHHFSAGAVLRNDKYRTSALVQSLQFEIVPLPGQGLQYAALSLQHFGLERGVERVVLEGEPFLEDLARQGFGVGVVAEGHVMNELDLAKLALAEDAVFQVALMVGLVVAVVAEGCCYARF